MQNIDIGDDVHHKPSGEDWIVARVTEKHVYPCGYPSCRADRSQSDLSVKATDESKNDIIKMCKKLPLDDERRIA